MKDLHAGADDQLSDQAIEWLVRLNSGHATPVDQQAFVRWRGQSHAHEVAAREAEVLWHGIGLAGGRLQKGARSGERRKLTRRSVIGIGGVGLIGAGLVQTGLLRLSMFAEYSTGIGERRSINLPDGSVVELNARSAMSTHYTPAQRYVSLIEGQATFTVKRETARPFLVDARKGRTRADGSVFDIDLRPEDVFVTTLDGTVVVSDLNEQEDAISAQRNQRVRYSESEAPSLAEDVDASVETAWRRGKLIFSSRSLRDVVAEIERYRTGKIVLVGSDLQRLAVTGVFDLTDPESVLKTIRQTLPVRITELPLVTIIRLA